MVSTKDVAAGFPEVGESPSPRRDNMRLTNTGMLFSLLYYKYGLKTTKISKENTRPKLARKELAPTAQRLQEQMYRAFAE